MVSSTERSARLRRARASSAAALAESSCASVAQPLARRSLARCFGGGGLRQHAGGGAEFGFRLLGLQLQIDFIERRERLADIDGLADLDQALGDFAGHPEAHVGLDPGLDGADETALRGFLLVMHLATRTGRAGSRFWATDSLQPARAIAISASETPAKSLE